MRTSVFAFSLLATAGLTLPVLANESATQAASDPNNWAMQRADYAATGYSKLDQINTKNVGTMKAAWTFSTGVLRGHEGSPLVIGSNMYVHTAFPNIVYSLNLDGDPYTITPACGWRNCAICGWNSCILKPASSTLSARATRNASCRWAQSGGSVESLPRSRTAQVRHSAFAGECFFDEARHAVCVRDTVAADQKSRPPRRGCAQHHAAHAAAQFCHAPAGARRGFARDSGIARPREHQHHGDLYACDGKPAAGHSPEISSPGVNRRADLATPC